MSEDYGRNLEGFWKDSERILEGFWKDSEGLELMNDYGRIMEELCKDCGRKVEGAELRILTTVTFLTHHKTNRTLAFLESLKAYSFGKIKKNYS